MTSFKHSGSSLSLSVQPRLVTTLQRAVAVVAVFSAGCVGQGADIGVHWTEPCLVSDSFAKTDSTRVLRCAADELAIALRILQQASSAAPSLPFLAYLKNVSNVTDTLPERVTMAAVEHIANGLRLAREQLASDASSLLEYLMIAKAVDPRGEWHTVPSRFVRLEQPEPEPPMVLSREDAWLDEALTTLWRDDADPATSFV